MKSFFRHLRAFPLLGALAGTLCASAHTALPETPVMMSVNGGGVYGQPDGPANLAVYGPDGFYNAGDYRSVTKLANGSANPDYDGKGYDFAVNVPPGFGAATLQIFDPDCYNYQNAVSPQSGVAIDSMRQPDGSDGTAANATTTQYTLYFDNDTPLETSDDVFIGSASYGNTATTDMKWNNVVSFDRAAYGAGNFRLNATTTSGSSANAFNLRVNKTGQTFSPTNGTSITAIGHLPVQFTGDGRVAFQLGSAPILYAQKIVSIRNFDADAAGTIYTHTSSSQPGANYPGDLSGNGNFALFEYYMPLGGAPYPATVYTAYMQALAGNVMVWDMSLRDTQTPKAYIRNVTIAEGAGSAVVNVGLLDPSDHECRVNYATVPGTATGPGDYTPVSGTLIFAPGETAKTFTVPIVNDALDEADETFTLSVTGTVGCDFWPFDGTPTITITDDDEPPALSINDVSVVEGNDGQRLANFRLALSAPSGLAITVDAATSDGNAKAGSDYAALATTQITIPAGVTHAYVQVPVNGDLLNEVNEIFYVDLSNAANATLVDPRATGIIRNDDKAPTISITDASITEGNKGTVYMVFTISLSAPSGQTVTVQYATINGTASAGSDYTARSGTMTFPAGVTSKTVSVAINGDAQAEPNETLFLQLSSATNATIARARGTGVIVNDDTSG
jgi:hypothetical protein